MSFSLSPFLPISLSLCPSPSSHRYTHRDYTVVLFVCSFICQEPTIIFLLYWQENIWSLKKNNYNNDLLREVIEGSVIKITSKKETYGLFLQMVTIYSVQDTVRLHYLVCLETKSFLVVGAWRWPVFGSPRIITQSILKFHQLFHLSSNLPEIKNPWSGHIANIQRIFTMDI